MLIFWSLVRNSVVLAVYLLFSVACFLTVHEHYDKAYFNRKMYYNKSKIIYKYMNDDYDDNLINQNIIEPSKLYSCNISNCIFNDRFNKIDKEEIIYNGGIVI